MFRRCDSVRSALAHGAPATLALVTLAPSLLLLGVTAQPAGASGGLRESATTTYVVDPAGRAIHVTVDLTATNTSPDVRRSDGILQYYYPGLNVGVVAEATNFSAVSDGGAALSVTSTPAPVSFAQDVEVHFSSNLYYNHTRVVHLHYDLPNGAPRSKSLTRVTSAFASFDAWANGDAGAANVSIVVPRAFHVDVVGASMLKNATGATVTYSATSIPTPGTWSVAVSARDDSKLASKNLTIGGHQVRIRAFPDDPAWSAFVDGRVANGLPKLEQLIGLPWVVGDHLLVTETVTPYLYGYAGWYQRRDHTIEIGDDLDPQVIIHELSHMWFNDVLFDERWIDEGLAQEYASRTVAELGGRHKLPEPVNARDRSAFRLNSWSAVNLQDENSAAREAYGYNASWYVIHRVTSEIGVARMRRVFAAASAADLPYSGRTSSKSFAEAHTWKGFLDYVDEIGGSKTADRLFARYVAPSSDTTLAVRTQARASYARLIAAGHGWKAPLVLRDAMSSWFFAEAEGFIDTANSVTATHARRAAGVGSAGPVEAACGEGGDRRRGRGPVRVGPRRGHWRGGDGAGRVD